MNNSTAYTPLECLLLFQSLVTYGVDNESFTTISNLITSNALVKDGETHDPARLTPDALQELYLHLLREELKGEQDGQQDGGQPASKKRKIPSPILPTIKDAQQYKDKLPLLVERLYARYSDHIVRGIREDERQYAALRKEIEELERIDEAERRLMEDKAKANKNGSLSPEDTRPKTNGTSPIVTSTEQTAEAPATTLQLEPAPKILSPVASPRPESRPEGLGIKGVTNTRTPPIRSPPKLEQRPLNGSQNVPPPSGPLQPPQQLGMAYTWEPPYQAGQPHPGHYQGHPYPPYNQPLYPQGYHPPPRGPFPGPHGVPPHLQVPSSPHNGPNQSILPPQSTVRRSPSSPGMQLDALADAAGQQYRALSGSPMQQHGPFPPGGYAYPQQRPPSGPIPANGPPPQWNQQYPPPYQGSPQQFFPPNQRPPFPVPPNLVSVENRQYNSPYNANHGPRPPMPVSAAGMPRQMYPGTPTGQSFPPFTTGSGTRWTHQPLTASSPAVPNAYTQSPAYEPLSPVLRPKKAPVSKNPATDATPKPDVPMEIPEPKGKRGIKRPAPSPVTDGRSTSLLLSRDDVRDELSLDVKEEVDTPLPLGEEDSGDTTADEDSALPPPRRLMSRGKRPSETPTSPTGRKRKRDDSTLNTPATPREPPTPPTHVLWTRNFGKISHAAQDFVTTHRLASLFAHPIKEQHAPGYASIILRPQDLKSIKASIAAGQKAAMEKEKSLGAEISKSDTSVWLPISEDLVPPKGIINYAQLEKELMRMFANAIMFNPDPQRGLGDRLGRQKDKKGGDGYEFDEDGVVKDARAMQADVEKMIGDLRAAEQAGAKGIPVLGQHTSVVRGSSAYPSNSVRGSSLARGSSVRGSSVAVTEDEVDELAGDMEGVSNNTGGSLAKRRRKA